MIKKINKAIDLGYYSLDNIKYNNNKYINNDFIYKINPNNILNINTDTDYIPVLFNTYKDYMLYKKKYYKYKFIFIDDYISISLIIGDVNKTNETAPLVEDLKSEFDLVKKITFGSLNNIEYDIFLNSLNYMLLSSVSKNENVIINLIGSSGTGKSTLLKKIICKFAQVEKNFQYILFCFENYNNNNSLVYISNNCNVNFTIDNIDTVLNINNDLFFNNENNDCDILNKFSDYSEFPRKHVQKTIENDKSSRSVLYYVIKYIDINKEIKSIYLIDNIGFESLKDITSEQLILFNDPYKIIEGLNIDEEHKELNKSGFYGYLESIKNFKSLKENKLRFFGNFKRMNILALPIESVKYKLRDYSRYKKLYWRKYFDDLFFYL